MAHVTKYCASAMGHMLNHYGRSKDAEKSEHVMRSNENIDPARTHLNHNLAEHQGMAQLDFVHQRLSEVKVQNRKDVNIMCDWIITLPKQEELKSLEREKAFFRAAYDFLENKYGRENVISAYVHKDEVQPHMHFAFIPVVADRRRGGEKVSAKECITRNDLKSFHEALQANLSRSLGFEVEILNEATKDGNKTISELKRGQAIQQAQEIGKEIKRLEKKLDALTHNYRKLSATFEQIDSINPEKGFFEKTITNISLEDIEKLKAYAKQAVTLSQDYALLRNDYEKLKKQVPSIEERMEQLKIKKERDEYKLLLDFMPQDIVKKQKQELKEFTRILRGKGPLKSQPDLER